MKKLYLVIIALFVSSFMGLAQGHDFSVVDGSRLIWQHVYNSDETSESIIQFLENSGKFSDIRIKENSICAKLNRDEVPFKRLGYVKAFLPPIVIGTDLRGNITIQCKPGKYRVTVESIYMIVRGGIVDGQESMIEKKAVSRGELSYWFNGKPSEVWQAYFLDLFTLPEKSFLNDEW